MEAANKIDDAEDGLQTEPDFTSRLTIKNYNIVADNGFVDKVINCVNSCASTP
jgi:hypothetical protein